MGSIIGKRDDFPPGTIREVNVQGKAYAIANVGGMLYAMDGRCGHAGGTLSHGHLVGIVVTCPKHGAEYDVTTGKSLKKPYVPFAKAANLMTYKVIVNGDSVILDI
ncbi:MAG: Rieske 2Fe-2S domain-containing protein [Methanomassiliicoccus sp.]|nr:Rieske 2Fe-2S domain-containing protein [Methanomassiliicoccus sp.]